MKSSPNYRAALDAGRALCLHIRHPWPGAASRLPRFARRGLSAVFGCFVLAGTYEEEA